jgi:hypothetical protein
MVIGYILFQPIVAMVYIASRFKEKMPFSITTSIIKDIQLWILQIFIYHTDNCFLSSIIDKTFTGVYE